MLRNDAAAGSLLAAVLLAILAFAYLLRATGYFSAVPGDLYDARYNSVVLEHLYRVVTDGAELWNPGFFYPYSGVLGFSDNHLGSGAAYVLARLAGLSREQAFGAWFAIGGLLNFLSALYVLRRLGLGLVAAAVGAFFYSFALPVPAQDTHAQLTYRFAAPLAVLALWRMFERRRLVELGRLAFFTAWQFYCSIYLGLFLAYLLAALAIAILLVRRPLDWQSWRVALAAEPVLPRLAAAGMLLVSILGLLYLLGHYSAFARTYKLDQLLAPEVIAYMLPRPGSYLIADHSSLLGWLGSDVSVPMRHEHNLFIGFGAIALIAAAAVAARRPAPQRELTQVMLIAVALLVVGTLWIGYLSFYYLIAWLPGISAIRGVSRIILVMLVPLSVLVALGAETAWRRLARSTPTAIAGLAGLAALVALEPLSVAIRNTPVAEWQARLRAAKALLPSVMPADPILFVRARSDALHIHAELDAMLLGQDLRYPVLNGYSAFAPPGYTARSCPSAADRLRGYSHFMGGADVSSYAQRLVVLDLEDCPPTAR